MQNSLLETHRQLGAHFFEQNGVQLVRDYGDVDAEVSAATNESGVIDLANYTVLRVDDQEGIAVLDRILKTDLQTMRPGSGMSKSVVDAQGHFIADLIVLAKENHFWIYASVRDLENLRASIRNIYPDEALSWLDARESIAILSVQGAFASDSLGRTIGRAIALPEFSWGAMQFFDAELVVVKHARTGVDGFDVLVPSEHVHILWEILISNHARPFGFAALNRAREEVSE